MIPSSEVRLVLGQQVADPANTDTEKLITLLIEQATATVGRELLDYFGPVETFVDVVDVHCCQGRLRVRLPRRIASVGAVEQRRSPFLPYEIIPATDTASGQANYVASGYDLLSRTGFYAGVGALRVTYDAGYDIGTGPAEIQAVVLALVVSRMRELTAQGTDTTGALKGETLGDYSYTRFSADELAAFTGWPEVRARWKRMLV